MLKAQLEKFTLIESRSSWVQWPNALKAGEITQKNI
jgi:hypothetical protein